MCIFSSDSIAIWSEKQRSVRLALVGVGHIAHYTHKTSADSLRQNLLAYADTARAGAGWELKHCLHTLTHALFFVVGCSDSCGDFVGSLSNGFFR